MRKIWNIPGGIHPPQNKEQSVQQAIAKVPVSDILILPLNQHIGAPALPIVKPGDKVLKGQLIAEANGFVSAAVHAPSSGTIAAIEDHVIPHPSGMNASCIIIHPDGDDRWIDLQANPNYRALSAMQLLTLIRSAGITGMGGAGFPSSVKLQPRQNIDTLIINATECEPYITADDLLIRERAEDIIIGVDILAHVLGDPECVLIGIEDNKPEAYEALESALGNTTLKIKIELVDFPTKYPSGGEKQIIQILTGQEVPSGKLPAELGIVCQNVGTTHAVFNAVCKGEPLISRVTTVTGNSATKPGNYEVLIGTPVNHLLASAGFDEFICQRLIMGGPMMGYTLDDLSAPVIKSTNCLLATDARESPPSSIAQACIRCGHCSEACPASLLPQQLYWYARAKDYDKLATHNLADCIECGACSYVCPSEIPLVQYYRAAKGESRLIEQESIVADRARHRFEYHQDRLIKAEQERTAKREARREESLKKAAELAKTSKEETDTEGNIPKESGETLDTDVIQAALARVSATKNSPEKELQRLQRAVTAAENRLDKAREKLEQCPEEDSRRTSFEAAIEQAQLRLNEAVDNLADHANAHSDSSDSSSSGQTAADHHDIEDQDERALDRAAVAIKNAQEKAAQQAEMSQQEKLVSQRNSLNKRLEKARSRLELAKADQDDNIEAYANAVAKLELKLSEADESLAKSAPDQDLENNLDHDKSRARLETKERSS